MTDSASSTTGSGVPVTTLRHRGHSYRRADLHAVAGGDLGRWPWVLRLLAENVVRTADEHAAVTALDALREWMADGGRSTAEITLVPGRLLMHDTTATPALVDIAAARATLAEHGLDPTVLNPMLPVEVSVDHSLAVEAYARPDAATRNLEHEIRRNGERYRFLRWADHALDNFHVNPPGTGIMHTLNLEQLATVAQVEERDGQSWLAPDVMVGTDSHTPMVNGLGVLALGVGGLEAQSVIFGMPILMRIPEIVGVRLVGALPAGVLATDLALAVTARLRRLGVTGEFVEFSGPRVSTLTVGDRAVVANMAPEYGATTGFFPVDEQTLAYLSDTGRPQEAVELVRAYTQAAGLWFDPAARPVYSRSVEIDLSTLQPSAAGPRRPQDLLGLGEIPAALREAAPAQAEKAEGAESAGSALPDYPVALAAITSCTNTSDPRLIITAALVARRARERGMSVPEWVKTSLAPGSPAAASYLRRSGLDEDFSALGFDIVGFGCTTCIGNSGPLSEPIARELDDTRAVAVLSGNRNFPGRVHPGLDLGLLLSPPLVVAYALAGDAQRDLTREPVGTDPEGAPVMLADLWPSTAEVDAALAQAVSAQDFRADFRRASTNAHWEAIEAPSGDLFPWEEDSRILRRPPFATADGPPLLGTYLAHPLLVLGDDVTTDHISPASAIPRHSPVAEHLVARGGDRNDLNVYASYRGNWEVMVRGAFHNHSLRNLLADQAPAGHTVHAPSGEVLPVWDVAQRYRDEGQPVVIIAGERYGMGSSRDWAAKAQHLLGVRAVLAASFERIHRTNLIGMGILPLVLEETAGSLLRALVPGDRVEVSADPQRLAPHAPVPVRIVRADGSQDSLTARAAIETSVEVEQLRAGGVLPLILGRHLSATMPGGEATLRTQP